MTSINSDFMSQLALRSLGNSSNMMTQAMERLSTGKRINSAADDAAGLGIATKLKAQVNSLNAAGRNASDALALVGTIDGALEESGEILQRMRELAVQSASDTNTGTDRTFIQDEINALNNELNRISTSTEFNTVKLLDGTYTDKSIQIGTGANQVFRIGISSTDSATLGAFQTNSANEAVSSTSAATAKSALNAQFAAAADYTVKGSFGTTTASVDAGADARDVAKTFNLLTGTTGISASVITKAKVQAGDATTYSFTLQGKSSTASTVNFTIASTSDQTALKDAINAVTGSTGIVASLTSDLSAVNLVQEEGYDIIMGDVTSAAASKTMVVNSVDKDGTAGANVTLTSGAANSAAFVGQVSLSSHKAFTITPGDAANHFNSNTDTVTSTLSTLGDINLKTQTGATNSIAVIDAAMAMISEVRSQMGAAENRLESTVDNLSNIAVNTQRSLSSVEDANFASETSALTKSQILQQAATSMLAQANQAKQSMLVLLQG
jgi:flagellin